MIFELARRIKKGTWLDKGRCCKYVQVSQERPCCFQVVALDCASQAIRLGRCHELSSLNLKTMLASIWLRPFWDWVEARQICCSQWCQLAAFSRHLGVILGKRMTSTSDQNRSPMSLRSPGFSSDSKNLSNETDLCTIQVGFAKMRGLAMDGNCKTFDTSADGFARGEGMGVETQETQLVLFIPGM